MNMSNIVDDIANPCEHGRVQGDYDGVASTSAHLNMRILILLMNLH